MFEIENNNSGHSLKIGFNGQLSNNAYLIRMTVKGQYIKCDDETQLVLDFTNLLDLKDEIDSLIEQKQKFDDEEMKLKEMREKIQTYETLKRELKEFGYLK